VRRIPFVAGVLLTPPLSAQQPPRWLATWAPSVHAARPKPSPDSLDRVRTWADRTFRQIVRTTLGGERLRIRLTNEYGERPLVIGAMHVAIRDTGAAVRPGTDRAITFGGRPSVIVGRSAVITSDPLEMPVPALTDLAISIWVKDTIRATTRHPQGLQTNYVSSPGDFTAAPVIRPDTTIRQWQWLAGVDVVNASATGVIVAFGNSITDGDGSSADSNSRWPDVLARRLLSSKEPAKAVINAGISGNGVLATIAGPSALLRFDRDALMQPGVTHVILLEGINDLGRGAASANPRDSVGAEDIIFGLRQLIDRAHERGVTIFGATLTPMANMPQTTAAAIDARRRKVNEWIRTSGPFDGVIDFDAVTRDPSEPGRFLPAYDSGDHLHPSDAGYKAMGESIALSLFRPARRDALVTDSVSSPGLASNAVGDRSVRRVLVYLPPSYARQPARRYPVLYLLHGATSTPEEWLNGVYQGLNLQLALDSLVAAAAIPEFIVVMPDADNALGGDWYANSPATGNWEDFVVRDLVRHVDGHYRTDPTVARRALVGHSMGGFGALAIGFNHPGVFGFIYAVSPCCIGFVGRLAPSGPAWPALSTITRWQTAPDRVRLLVGMAAALDGSRSDPRLFAELPFRSENGTVVPDPAAQARWLARMPPDLASAMVRRGERAPVIHVEAGSEESPILDGIRLLRQRLDSLHIAYTDTTFAGGHIDRVRERFTRAMLPAVGKWFGRTPEKRLKPGN
jgi:enterochelin esterase-like enzyme/lysophospholipase L1-like esterase